MTYIINKLKKKIYREDIKTIYLHKCGERLKWLANQKTEFVANLLSHIGNTRSLTFCSNIEQTELLGKYCINSKNKDAVEHLEMFNKGKINHITACNMLDEGVNLVKCQMGIFANINSSERMQRQRLGRILRHKKPIIVVPYYRNTREEEIVQKMKRDYNPELITVINDLKDLNV
jgi:superfamily II DNA or RNA helicase